MDWKRHVELAEHHLALGQREISLADKDEKPWEYVTECKSGGLVRWNVSVTVWMTAKHESGLTFSWHLDLEPRQAHGELTPNVDDVSRAIRLLSPRPAKQLASAIRAVAVAAKEQADEYSRSAAKQREAAFAFEQLADRAESDAIARAPAITG